MPISKKSPHTPPRAGMGAVVVTGGHLPTTDVVDILFDGHELVEFSGPRLADASTHGTGCTFSAAIAAAIGASGAVLGTNVVQKRAPDSARPHRPTVS